MERLTIDDLMKVTPGIQPPLDMDFCPAYLERRRFALLVHQSGMGVPLKMALERSGGHVSVFSMETFPEGHPQSPMAYRLAERILKFLLWQKGGVKVYVCGPSYIAQGLIKSYQSGGERAFDADFMAKVFEKPFFEVLPVSDKDFP